MQDDNFVEVCIRKNVSWSEDKHHHHAIVERIEPDESTSSSFWRHGLRPPPDTAGTVFNRVSTFWRRLARWLITDLKRRNETNKTRCSLCPR